MLWLLAVFVGLAAANLDIERGIERGRTVVVSRQPLIIPQRKIVLRQTPLIVSPQKTIIVPSTKVIVPESRLGYSSSCSCPCHRYPYWTGMRIVESHQPVYNVRTKVAAPVYILPKHGPVVAGKRTFAPCNM